MLYDPVLDPEFSQYNGTYCEHYVDHDALSDESIARYRRYKAFIDASGLIEEPWIPSFKHGKIEKILPARDHISYFWFGGRGKIPFVLLEPYVNYQGPPNLIKFIEVPESIAPYGGGPFSTKLGYMAPSKSLLCVKDIHSKYLDIVAEKVISAAEKLPSWNSVSDEEREASRQRSEDGQLSKASRGSGHV